MTMPMPRRCSAPLSTARTFRTWVSPTSPGRGSGRPISCTGTTTSTGTAASATSPRHSAMPAGTAPSSPHVMRSTSGRARPTRADGVGAPATGRRSAPSPSTPSATASSPPRAPWQAHRLSVGGCAHHRQDRRPHYETSAATTLTRTGLATGLYDPVEAFKEDGNQFADNLGRELAGASASVEVSAGAGVYGGPLGVLAAAPLSELAEAGVEKAFEAIPVADDYSEPFTALAARQ